MPEVPPIAVDLFASSEAPGGIGEMALLVAPAIANAVFALTGKRARPARRGIHSPEGQAGR